MVIFSFSVDVMKLSLYKVNNDYNSFIECLQICHAQKHVMATQFMITYFEQ